MVVRAHKSTILTRRPPACPPPRTAANSNSFAGLSYDNLIKPLDPWNDLEDNYGKGAMKRFTNLKRINPDLKTLVAIGGECC